MRTRRPRAYVVLVLGRRLKTPSVVLSVVGSAQWDPELDPMLERGFVKGLALAAEASNAWVTTGGTNTGVMALVGKAVRSLQGKQSAGVATPCIGELAGRERTEPAAGLPRPAQPIQAVPIRSHLLHRRRRVAGVAPWAKLVHRDRFVRRIEGSSRECISVQYNASQSGSDGEIPLEPNHSHFLLVDNGKDEWGADVPLRSALEEYIRAHDVPAVLIVVQGGPFTCAPRALSSGP